MRRKSRGKEVVKVDDRKRKLMRKEGAVEVRRSGR